MAHVKGLRYLKSRKAWFACHSWRDEQGKQHQLTEKLSTNEQTALRQLPEALRRLKLKARGIHIPDPLKPSDEGLSLDEHGREIRITAAEVFEPEELQITWQQALEIHLRRREEATGRPLSDSTIKILRHSIKGLAQGPSSLTAALIREEIESMRAGGLTALTIRKRMAMLQAITNSLIKGGYLGDEYTNPFTRVDFSARSRNHRHTATPEECRAIMSLGCPELQLQLYCGWRTDEIKHLTIINGWAELKETSSYRPKNDYSLRKLPIPEGLQLTTRRGRGRLNVLIKGVAPACTSYSLRHAWRTAAREAQIPTDMAEFMFGHALPSMLATYGAFTDAAVYQSMLKVWRIIDLWIYGQQTPIPNNPAPSITHHR